MIEKSEKGTLYLVATPIGNLSDISQRALEVLSTCQVIACEDTRVTGWLLAHFGIRKKLVSYHDFNEAERSPMLLKILLEGGDVAVTSDAGSPGLSDPAFRIIRAAIENEIRVSPLPGPNALVPALTGSGLPLDRFFFEGFLPPKKGARKNRLEKLGELEHTLIFYESPHRIQAAMADALEILGDRPACLAREISKIHEEFIRGSLSDIIRIAESRKLKGEMVLIIAGRPKIKKKKRQWSHGPGGEKE